MPGANYGRPLSVVRISVFSDFEATHANRGISVGSSPIGIVKVLPTPRQGEGEAILNQYYNNFVAYSYHIILQDDVYVCISSIYFVYYDDQYSLRWYHIFLSKLRRIAW